RELKRITHLIDPKLEVTEISDRTLKQNGPALLFENLKNCKTPLLANLFGSQKRIAQAMGLNDVSQLRELGHALAALKDPDPPSGLKEAWQQLPLLKQALTMAAKVVKKAPCQEIELSGKKVDITQFPIQTCWPGD